MFRSRWFSADIASMFSTQSRRDERKIKGAAIRQLQQKKSAAEAPLFL